MYETNRANKEESDSELFDVSEENGQVKVDLAGETVTLDSAEAQDLADKLVVEAVNAVYEDSEPVEPPVDECCGCEPEPEPEIDAAATPRMYIDDDPLFLERYPRTDDATSAGYLEVSAATNHVWISAEIEDDERLLTSSVQISPDVADQLAEQLPAFAEKARSDSAKTGTLTDVLSEEGDGNE